MAEKQEAMKDTNMGMQNVLQCCSAADLDEVVLAGGPVLKYKVDEPGGQHARHVILPVALYETVAGLIRHLLDVDNPNTNSKESARTPRHRKERAGSAGQRASLLPGRRPCSTGSGMELPWCVAGTEPGIRYG
jgi:hypothetical protein